MIKRFEFTIYTFAVNKFYTKVYKFYIFNVFILI